ncbi:MAG TPA: hypothetical protein VKJ01_16725 [Candidatus Solibacter sp.]|nr:hypothetical protein [Candidatus Solibacter sp.]
MSLPLLSASSQSSPAELDRAFQRTAKSYCAAASVTTCTGAVAGFAAGFLDAVFLNGAALLTAFAGAAFTALLTAVVFRALFPALAGCALAASDRTRSQRFFVAAMILFMPSSLIRRLGFGGSCVAFDGDLEGFTGGFFAVLEDACKLTATFARVTAACASSSASRIWGVPAEYRFVTAVSDASILASRLRALFAFMVNPRFPFSHVSLRGGFRGGARRRYRPRWRRFPGAAVLACGSGALCASLGLGIFGPFQRPPFLGSGDDCRPSSAAQLPLGF